MIGQYTTMFMAATYLLVSELQKPIIIEAYGLHFMNIKWSSRFPYKTKHKSEFFYLMGKLGDLNIRQVQLCLYCVL
jgi:hypothetical protein